MSWVIQAVHGGYCAASSESFILVAFDEIYKGAEPLQKSSEVPPDVFVHLYQWVFSADTFACRPAERVVMDDKGESPMFVPLFILVGLHKFMMSLNTNPNPQFQILIPYLYKHMNQTSQFEDSPFNCKIQKQLKVSP